MKAYRTTSPDPAWLSSIAARRAVLWLGQSLQTASEDERKSLARLIAHPWLAIYVESDVDISDLRDAVDGGAIAPFTLRNVTRDPDDVNLAPNRIPVFQLPSNEGNSLTTLHRLKMLQRISPGAVVFAVSNAPEEDSVGLAEAVQISTDIAEVTLVSEKSVSFELPCRRFVHWVASVQTFDEFIFDLAAPQDVLRRAATIAVREKKTGQSRFLPPVFSPQSRFLPPRGGNGHR